ncbi:MAG: hypothetical protein KGH94_00165 [Candidatus Micrarchaeota archaeon]|nr:hypothetical protein [Candidatus Micrarchaeota archaeon]
MGERKPFADKTLTVLTKSKHSPLDLAHIKREAEEHYLPLRGLGIIVVSEDCGSDTWALFLRSSVEAADHRK